jgi:nicotinate-nucleotide adenylyltransferase
MVVTWLLATGKADAVWLLPTGVHAFGKSLAPFADRVKMVRAALGSLGLGRRVRVETIEGRSRAPSYTIDTVRALRKKHPRTRFSLVVGTDILPDLPKWREYGALRKLVAFIAVRRSGIDGCEREDPANPSPLFPEVSSTDVRRRIAAGEDVTHLVPASVVKIARRLYRTRRAR